MDALSGALVIYTQYIGVLILGLHIGFVLLTWKKNRQLIWWIGQSHTIIVLLFVPWLVAVAEFYTGFDSDKLPPPNLYQLFLLFVQLFFGYITDNALFNFIQPVLTVIVVIFLLITMTVLLPAIISTSKVKTYTKVFLLAPFIFFAGFFGLSFLTSVMEVRYLICITPFIYLLIGKFLAIVWKKQSFFVEPAFNYYFNNRASSPLIFGPTSTELKSNPDFVNRLNPPTNTHIVWVVQSYWERPENPTLQYYRGKYPLVEYHIFSPELRLFGFWIGGS